MTWLKLRMWWHGYRWSPRAWYREIWLTDPNDRMCCDGYMCGCYGACHATYWEHLLK